MAHRIGRALVQHHQDVAAEGQLHVHRRYWSELVQVAIQVRLETHAFFGDLAQSAQAEDLEAAGIGKDRAGPGRETVQAAELPDQFMPGPQKQMIRIAQDNLNAADRPINRAAKVLSP